MRLLLIFLSIIISQIISGQSLKKIKNTHVRLGGAEIYYVLKRDTSVRHGKYLLRYTWEMYKDPIESGFYENNKKTGEWIEYFSLMGSLKRANRVKVKSLTEYKNDLKNGKYYYLKYTGDTLVKGQYFNDRQTGIWSFYTESGVLREKYDYTNNISLFQNDSISSINKVYILKNDSLILTKVDYIAEYKGGSELLMRQIAANLVYPESAVTKGISGIVTVEFFVDTDGEMKNIKIYKTVDAELDKEAIRVIESLPNKWNPAMINFKPLISLVRMNVAFVK